MQVQNQGIRGSQSSSNRHSAIATSRRRTVDSRSDSVRTTRSRTKQTRVARRRKGHCLDQTKTQARIDSSSPGGKSATISCTLYVCSSMSRTVSNTIAIHFCCDRNVKKFRPNCGRPKCKGTATSSDAKIVALQLPTLYLQKYESLRVA